MITMRENYDDDATTFIMLIAKKLIFLPGIRRWVSWQQRNTDFYKIV